MRPLGDLLQGVLKSEDKPNVLSRSVAQVVVSESGLVRRLLQESLEEHLFPAEAMQHCKKQTEPFLQRCESMFLHMLKLTHLNRARRFRRLAHVFPDFNELQLEAYRLDDTLRSTFGANLQYSRPSWIFIMDHALQAMITKLLIGFQLDIYEEAELHMIYWYVDYLSGLRIHYLNEMYCAKESSGGKKKVPRAKDILSGKGSKPEASTTEPCYALRPCNPWSAGFFASWPFAYRKAFCQAPNRSVQDLPSDLFWGSGLWKRFNFHTCHPTTTLTNLLSWHKRPPRNEVSCQQRKHPFMKHHSCWKDSMSVWETEILKKPAVTMTCPKLCGESRLPINWESHSSCAWRLKSWVGRRWSQRHCIIQTSSPFRW